MVEHLYRTQRRALRRLARRYLDTECAAEDAVQEAFVRFAALRIRPAEGRELAYLRSIVLNEARSTLRRRLVIERYAPTLIATDELDGTSVAVERRESVRQLRSAINVLSFRQRQVVTLRHISQLTERETAELLAISPGSVKTHCRRALAAMRENLELATSGDGIPPVDMRPQVALVQ